VPIKTPEGFFGVVDDQAEMIEAVCEHLYKRCRTFAEALDLGATGLIPGR
jgi:hypothetical protein